MVLPDSFRCLSRGCCSAAPHRFHFGRRPGELSVISFICYYKLHVQSGSGFYQRDFLTLFYEYKMGKE